MPPTRFSWFALFSGPYSTSASEGGPVRVPRACSASASAKSSATRGATSTLVAAVQSCPALKYPAIATASAVPSISASSNTITGAFPPSSRCTRLRSVAPDAATSMPARVDPVIDTMAGVLCATSARPVSRSPQMTFSTPGGRNSAAISASRTVLTGVVSLGLSTTVLPAAMAGASFQIAIIIG